MGPSGSGKTTLMATISHRMKGNFDGELLLNGQPITEEMMIQMSGFIPQQDVCFDQLTASEHLTLMAKLRIDRHTTTVAVKERVDRITSELGMSKFLDTRISFLSGGERNKISLAVQLLHDPSVLFCDEITTGLDSYSAAHIVNILRGVARTGKIVVCTIHQPASGVYGKFDEVALLSNGRLAYHGPVTMVHQLYERFNYKCPPLFNEADFVISILNSDTENVKSDVDQMCRLSSTDQQTDIDFDISDYKRRIDCIQHNIQTRKPLWISQFSLILNRSIKCFLRSYQIILLEIGAALLLALIVSLPFSNLQFDRYAIQNWEGFWFVFVANLMLRCLYSIIPIYLVKLSIIHREIHNKMYPLSVYYVAELIIMVVWIMIKSLIFCITTFTIVGVQWGGMELFVTFLLAYSASSFGAFLSACTSDIEHTFIIATFYQILAYSISGIYMSFNSLPKFVYNLRHFSLFFLGCELMSTLFWDKIPHLSCIDVENCLDSGKAVLNKYGYISGSFYSDITILISFCVLANILCYFGLLKKIEKQPAY